MERLKLLDSLALSEHMANEAKKLRRKAKLLPPGAERETVLRRARQCETSSHIKEWLNSSGLQPPS